MRTARGSGAEATGRRGAARRIVCFLGLFVVYVVAGHALFALPAVESGFVEVWTRLDVSLATALAAPFVEGADSTGTWLWARDTTVLEASRGCDGINALLILGSTILAFPATWRARLAGLAAGTLAVFVINAGRLASLLWVARFWPARLDFFHVDVWQPAMMLIAFALFFAWGSVATRGRSHSPASPGRVA